MRLKVHGKGRKGRFPSGKRGLKLVRVEVLVELVGRFPSGKRGLKPSRGWRPLRRTLSLPFGEAWIETSTSVSVP